MRWRCVRHAALELVDGNLGETQIHGRVELGFGNLASRISQTETGPVGASSSMPSWEV